jgi:hypothetical protein
MSHFTPVKLEIRNFESLQTALTALKIQFQTGNLSLFNDYWEERNYKSGRVTVQLLIHRSQINSDVSYPCNADIGFQLNEVGTYDLIADPMELSKWCYRNDNPTRTKFEANLSEHYALAEVARKLGNTLAAVSREVLADGTIRLRLEETANASLVEEVEQENVLALWS